MKTRIMTFIAAICLSMVMALSCRKETPVVEPQLPVNFYNTAGTWELVSWSGGDMTGTSVRIVLKDRKFELTHDVGSMYPVTYTGSYNLVTREDDTVVIRGIYDYTYGYWAHDYRIGSLTASEMLWVADDAPDDIYRYRRID